MKLILLFLLPFIWGTAQAADSGAVEYTTEDTVAIPAADLQHLTRFIEKMKHTVVCWKGSNLEFVETADSPGDKKEFCKSRGFQASPQLLDSFKPRGEMLIIKNITFQPHDGMLLDYALKTTAEIELEICRSGGTEEVLKVWTVAKVSIDVLTREVIRKPSRKDELNRKIDELSGVMAECGHALGMPM